MQDLFALRPLETAEVSEISELTAAAQVRPEERVGFHIGNPVHDVRLVRAFQGLVLQVGPVVSAQELEQAIVDQCTTSAQRERLRWFLQLVDKSVGYLPRGGFPRRDPGRTARTVQTLFTQVQEEPLDYDLGDATGRREITFVSGGKVEAVRMLLYALERQLERTPGVLHLFDIELPSPLLSLKSLRVGVQGKTEALFLEQLRTSVRDTPELPHFLLLGRVPTEAARREIRQLSVAGPVFVIEANGAPNHRSLAREAGLANRVIRILEAGDLRPDLSGIGIAVCLGRSDYIDGIEKAHFELKGTPSAPELEFLGELLSRLEPEAERDVNNGGPDQNPDDFGFGPVPATFVPTAVTERLSLAGRAIGDLVTRTTRRVAAFPQREIRLSTRFAELPLTLSLATVDDPFRSLPAADLVDQLFTRHSEPAWTKELHQAFLSAFLQHNPHYDPEACRVVSGSARTALGLIGRYCGIREAVIPDLSWTYEHCFETVHAVPLKDDLQLDAEAILGAVDALIEEDESWRERGAVVLNSPHNATGRVFREEKLRELLQGLLERGVWVIDDLSYKGVAPTGEPFRTRSLRELANEMTRIGELRPEALSRLITVQSISKTDCLAGARLAVVEIPDEDLRRRFDELANRIAPNVVSILLAYLSYRNSEGLSEFWNLRNRILEERLQAIKRGCSEVPAERNRYGAEIIEPEGGMYPLLLVRHLPEGVSLRRIAKSLAGRGIGLVPFATFARTARGYDLARKAFRLTLGGADSAEALTRKVRRVIIDLNRIIEHEAGRFTLSLLPPSRKGPAVNADDSRWERAFRELEGQVREHCRTRFYRFVRDVLGNDTEHHFARFMEEVLPERLAWVRQKFRDSAQIVQLARSQAVEDPRGVLERFAEEIAFADLEKRRERFRRRLFDRTVHPTQMFALDVERSLAKILKGLRQGRDVGERDAQELAEALMAEYLGSNVAIRSREEAWEAVIDMDALVEAEDVARWRHGVSLPIDLSFWGDWDGSTRPSGQGHRLVAAMLLENLDRLWQLVRRLRSLGVPVELPAQLQRELEQLDERNRRFWKLMDEITNLTSQLEKRYTSILPIGRPASRLRQFGMRLGLARDPVTALWLHNDRLERRMLRLRAQRREWLFRYFRLNRDLHVALQEQLELIGSHVHRPEVATELALYRGLLKRFYLTPRIHQKMVLSRDQFAVDTTVHNMVEINWLSGSGGFPGMVLGLQISMATDPEAAIALDRKLRAKREETVRSRGAVPLPEIWIIPLFEDLETLQSIEEYLDRLWEYSVQSRRIGQDPAERFKELTCELFIAGSDLSQQVGQFAGLNAYREAKHRIFKWLADRGIVEGIRVKLGSGEPAQRQAGYYDPSVGKPITVLGNGRRTRLLRAFSEVEMEMLRRAKSPLRGVLAEGEFRTFQSNLFERLRLLSAEERAQVLHHVWQSQRRHQEEIRRAASALLETRYRYRDRSLRELTMLTLGRRDEHLDRFLDLLPKHFRHILYGREEDIVGIHVISYFVSRTLPPLRDRPVVRPGRRTIQGREQEIVKRIAETLPLARHGSLLRAIGHNRAQTAILGVNQLTTGLFRALRDFVDGFESEEEGWRAVEDSILPHLPVYDILHTLRLYHDPDLTYVRRLEDVFPPGNSSLLALREDNDALRDFVPALQRELLRRCGLESDGFFESTRVRRELMPLLSPEVAVLVQRDLFNCDADAFFGFVGMDVDPTWANRVRSLLEVPTRVRKWRDQIWRIIEKPVRWQVESFVELAQAVHHLAGGTFSLETPLAASPGEVLRIGAQIASLLRGAADDTMRQFLIAAVRYLTELPKEMDGVPVEVVRALRDVERIVKIEEQALTTKEQAQVRFYALQIARICGENG